MQFRADDETDLNQKYIIFFIKANWQRVGEM